MKQKKLEVPSLSPEQMRRADDLMVKRYSIQILQMMEHDARALTEAAKHLFKGSVAGLQIVVVSGKGGNGAGGLAAARHMHNAGAEVEVVIAGAESQQSKEGKQHAKTLNKIGVSIKELAEDKLPQPFKADLVLDALLGYSSEGDPRPPYDVLINAINEAGRTGAAVLANDIPSGLDVVSGLPHSPCVKAHATLTLGLPKLGLMTEAGQDWVGKLYLADIGIPPELYNELDIEFDTRELFEKDWIVQLSPP